MGYKQIVNMKIITSTSDLLEGWNDKFILVHSRQANKSGIDPLTKLEISPNDELPDSLDVYSISSAKGNVVQLRLQSELIPLMDTPQWSWMNDNEASGYGYWEEYLDMSTDEGLDFFGFRNDVKLRAETFVLNEDEIEKHVLMENL